MTLAELIGLPASSARAVIGMVHLRALPGSPRWDGDMAALVRAALDDARALAVAAATGARFVRVNVHVGAVAADQGIIESDAHDTLRYRRLLGVAVAILADVQAKHGLPLAPMPIEQEARDCYARGLADALVVSGVATGEPTPMADLKRVRGAVPEAPLLVGSGASPETVAELLSVADAVIVGTSIKRDGQLSNPVDVERVRRLVAAARGARG